MLISCLQQPRASHCSMFSIQVAGVVALTLLLLLVAALMRPGRRSEQQAADRPWASYNADQVLSLLGMVSRPGCKPSEAVCQQRCACHTRQRAEV